MFPSFSFFGHSVPAYGLLAGIGLIAAVVYLKLLQPQRKENAGDVELLFIWGIVGAFVGAKLLYIITVASAFWNDLPTLFTQPAVFVRTYISSGFVFYGGLIGVLVSVLLYCRKNHISVEYMLMRMLPVVPLIHAIGRLGCFCVGCCYGIETSNSLLGIAFHNSSVAPNGVLLLPVQLYEAIFVAGIFVVLAIMSAKEKSGIFMLGFYLTLYGAGRFLLEFLRGDLYRGFLLGLSVSQIISIAAMITGVFLLGHYRRKASAAA